jgi:hypothetical protein
MTPWCELFLPSATFIIVLIETFRLPNVTQHIPWFLPIIRRLPLINSGMDNMKSFAQTQVKKRLKETPAHPDLFHYMVRPSHLTLQRSIDIPST